jgi:hypothetical protein
MKEYKVVIYLIGFLALFTTKSAIASDAVQNNLNSSKNPSATITQATKINIFNSCDPIPNQVSSFSKINKLKNTNKADNKPHVNKQKDFNYEPTKASFWWAIEQFDPFEGKLIQNLLTSPKKQQINLTVNWQLWILLDYLGRYRFVNQFGTVARRYGYSLNIFNQKEQCLGYYKYNSVSNPPKWELYLEKLGRDSLEVEPTQRIHQDEE